MEEIEKSELTIFKEEILKIIHEIENKLAEQIKTKTSKINNDYEIINHKLDSMLESNSTMIESFTKQKMQNQKVDDLEKLIKVIDERLITNEIRTKNNINEFDRVKNSYDKILSENLNVPGIVGIGCLFKNVSDYIANNVKEINKIKADIEILKTEKKIQNKPDALLMKNINSMLELNLIKSKGYTDTATKNLKDIFIEKDKEAENIKIEFKDIMNEYQLITDSKINSIEKLINKFQKEKTRNSIFLEKTDDYNKKNEEVNKRIQNLEKISEKYNSAEVKIYDQLGIAFNEITEIKKQLKNNYQICLGQIKTLTETNIILKNNIKVLEKANITNNVNNNILDNTNSNAKGVYGSSVQKILKKKAPLNNNNNNALPLLNSNQTIKPNYSPQKNTNKESVNNKETTKIVKEEKKIYEEDIDNLFKKNINHINNRNNKKIPTDLAENDDQKLINSINGPTIRNIINRNNDIIDLIKNNNFIEKNNNVESNDNLEKNKNEKKETISRNFEIKTEKSNSFVEKNIMEKEKQKIIKNDNEIENIEKDDNEKEKNKTNIKEDKEKININENNQINNNEEIKIMKSYKERDEQNDVEENKNIPLIQTIKEYKDNNSKINFFTTNLRISKSKPHKTIQAKTEDDSKKKNIYSSSENKKNEYKDFKIKYSNNIVNSYKNIKINNSRIYMNTNENKSNTLRRKTSNSFIKNEDPKTINTEYNINNNNEIESIKEILRNDKNKNYLKKEDRSIINNANDTSYNISNEKEIENSYKNAQTSLYKDRFLKHSTLHNKLFSTEFNEIHNSSLNKQKESHNVSNKNIVDCKLVNLNNVDVPKKEKSLSEKNSDLLNLKKNGLSPPLGGKLPLKASPAFGRTAYTFYNSKDSGQISNNMDNNYNITKNDEGNVEFIPFSVKNGNNS